MAASTTNKCETLPKRYHRAAPRYFQREAQIRTPRKPAPTTPTAATVEKAPPPFPSRYFRHADYAGFVAWRSPTYHLVEYQPGRYPLRQTAHLSNRLCGRP